MLVKKKHRGHELTIVKDQRVRIQTYAFKLFP